MPALLAYHNDKTIKAKYLARVRLHAEADEIVQGQYWEGGKGCAVGCTIHGSDHGVYETELGIPREVAVIEDVIFEGLSNDKAKAWPERFLAAIKPGQDLSLIWPKFSLRILTDKKHGMATIAKDYPEALKIIRSATALFERHVAGNPPSAAEWHAAWMAAMDAMDARAAMATRDAMDARAAMATRDEMAAMATMTAMDARAAMTAMAAMDARAAMTAMATRAAMTAMATRDEMAAMAAMAASWSRFADWLIELIEAA
jgi:hypothetical protein